MQKDRAISHEEYHCFQLCRSQYCKGINESQFMYIEMNKKQQRKFPIYSYHSFQSFCEGRVGGNVD